MEKAIGVPLFERWDKMPEIEKLELIKNMTQLEAQLSAISFPAYGGLYLRADADRLKHQDLDSKVFCIGPLPDRSFDFDAATNLHESINNGPCKHSLFFIPPN